MLLSARRLPPPLHVLCFNPTEQFGEAVRYMPPHLVVSATYIAAGDGVDQLAMEVPRQVAARNSNHV